MGKVYSRAKLVLIVASFAGFGAYLCFSIVYYMHNNLTVLKIHCKCIHYLNLPGEHRSCYNIRALLYHLGLGGTTLFCMKVYKVSI